MSYNNSLKDLYLSHQGRASDKCIHYFDIYHENFSMFIGKKSNILEIGVQNGGSSEIFSKYFQNGNIYGVDINPKVCEHQLGKNNQFFCFDIRDKNAFEKVLGGKTFDVLIDDGSHLPKDIIFAFEYLFEKINPGGVYLIEDVYTSYWKSHDGGLQRSGTAMEYFKQLSDYIYYYCFEEDDLKTLDTSLFEMTNSVKKDNCVIKSLKKLLGFQGDKNKKERISDKALKEYAKWISHITFYEGVIVVKKSETPKLKVHDRIVVGKEQPVVPTIDVAKSNGYYVDQVLSK